MNWNLEGQYVTGKYMDQIMVTGQVRLSRVKYGGDVCHHIDLLKPITVYGTERLSVILDHKEIECVFDNCKVRSEKWEQED
jgi:hypothetical protein